MCFGCLRGSIASGKKWIVKGREEDIICVIDYISMYVKFNEFLKCERI